VKKTEVRMERQPAAKLRPPHPTVTQQYKLCSPLHMEKGCRVFYLKSTIWREVETCHVEFSVIVRPERCRVAIGRPTSDFGHPLTV